MKDDIKERIAALPPDKRALFELQMKSVAKAAPSATYEPGLRSAAPGASRKLPQFTARDGEDKKLDFSLFFFSDNGATYKPNKYHLLLECAKYADANDFAAVWTPERHFKPFGGLYPNPSVITAALSMITSRVELRAGSIVLPLQNPLRVAEEWSTVDNLSGGRVGVAFASGWLADDFVLAPERYAERKSMMFREIETVKKLWRGESIRLQNGKAVEVDVRIYPNPIQQDLPIWITATHQDTFIEAGKIRANVLTGLMEQSLEQCAECIKAYRHSLSESGHDPREGRVAIMLHTFLGTDLKDVKETTRGPFCEYLRSFLRLTETKLSSGPSMPIGGHTLEEQDQETLLNFAFERYFNTSALFGTSESCWPMINALKASDADEVACLLDFGLETETILNGLVHLNARKEATCHAASKQPAFRKSFPA
ncbi:MAG TPA: MupA/Atu3671 family FMN-dependent luciferase-like monooxygenase [Pyrinomonadaceae bacterium]|nr:MupA/Atu3671 family FMN-dependent luciferase-like monooxygenase [Pyrinomonadaceae bacterium]